MINKTRLNILLVEDAESDVRLIKEYIKRSSLDYYEVDRVKSMIEFKANKNKPNIILLDLNLPDSHGLDTVDAVHAHSPDVPIVVLTGMEDTRLGVAAIGKGAQDYLTKDEMSPDLLAKTIRHAIGRQGLMDELEKANERQRYLATHDLLTGLPNRLFFQEVLDKTISEAKRHNRKIAVLFMDLDYFKKVNDRLGHDYGDMLLTKVAERLLSLVRSEDVVSRLGGDEFAIVMRDLQNREAVDQMAVRVLSALSQKFIIDGETATVSGSIGISLYPESGVDRTTLLKRADTAMYEAKKAGRNQYKIDEGV